MEKTVRYLCHMVPLENYFLGGERNFDFGESDRSGKSDYYIESEYNPSQPTLFGMLRFLVLKKAGRLNNAPGALLDGDQIEFIGRKGFSIENCFELKNYGKLKKLEPLFITNEDGSWLVPVPLNHKKGAENYMPFSMAAAFRTDIGETTILPADYNAKDGLESGYLNLETQKIVPEKDIYYSAVHTRIAKTKDEDAFFKMKYRGLKNGYRFSFICETEGDVLPHDEIVYIGQGKSAFHFTAEETNIKCVSENIKTMQLGAPEGYSVYYALSDAYLENEISSDFSVVKKKLIRTLGTTGKNGYRDSMKKSRLFYLVSAGSVFYVKDTVKFETGIKCDGAQQIGMNCFVKTEAKNEK